MTKLVPAALTKIHSDGTATQIEYVVVAGHGGMPATVAVHADYVSDLYSNINDANLEANKITGRYDWVYVE